MIPVKLLKFLVNIMAAFVAFPQVIYGMSDAYRQGNSLTQNLSIPKPSDPKILPGYGGAEIPASKLQAKDIGEASLNAARENEGSKLLTETFEKKEKFVIDPLNDPLIVAGNKAVANPQNALEDEIIEVEGKTGNKDEMVTCEESGEEYNQKCSRLLEVDLKVIPEITRSYRYCHGQHPAWGRGGSNWSCYDGCVIGTTITQHKKVDVIREEWMDGCAVLENLAEKGLCRYISKATSQKNETRTIQNEPITRDHWEEYLEYACLKAPTQKKSCDVLRSKGCYQVKSTCKEKVGNVCTLWEYVYQCPSSKVFGKTYRSSNKQSPFCLQGDCTDTSYEANQDFADVMGQLSVFREAQKDLRNKTAIFKGQDWRCTRNCLNFRDCCGNGKGWGVSLHLSSCDESEKTLAELRKKNRCLEVGTYCAEREPVFKTCLRKKTTFCCYDTRLAKIVQEQGRQQLGAGFGSPEHPQCRGLTVEELARLDFSRIDFSALFSDIAASTKVPNTQTLAQDIQKSMKNRGTLLEGNFLKIQEKEGQKSPSLIGENDQQIGENKPLPSTPMNVQGRAHGDF